MLKSCGSNWTTSGGGTTELPNLQIVQWFNGRPCYEQETAWSFQCHGGIYNMGVPLTNSYLPSLQRTQISGRDRLRCSLWAERPRPWPKSTLGNARPWPQHFRAQKALCGLAAAAIVNATPKDNTEAHPLAFLETSSKRHWTVEEEAVKNGVRKFGVGSWNEIKADDSALANRSVVQIKQKASTLDRRIERKLHLPVQAKMAWFRVALALLLLAFTATAEVVPLTDATFAESVNSDSLWFIDFYVDWCPWSQRLVPAWEQLGNDEEVRQAGVEVGIVDCDNSQATCMKVKVLEYPSMKIFYKGEFLDEYTGARDSKCMKAFALGFQVGQAAVDAAIPVTSNSTGELEEEPLRDPRISVRMLPRMLLNFFGF